MWRFLVGGLAALALAGAGVVIFNRGGQSIAALPPAPRAPVGGEAQDAALPDTVPAASDRTREQKRFDRYDKDRDATITRAEYLLSRRKAFARLDTDHDGTLSFDEWAIKAESKFASADKDKSGTMTAAEFATTAVKRKPSRIRRDCPPAEPAPARDDEG